MNGFDLDGVITLGIRPAERDVIITSRSADLAGDTVNLLRSLGITNHVFLNPERLHEVTHKGSMQHKARMIEALNVRVFFEDDEETVDYLIEACQKTTVIYVKA